MVLGGNFLVLFVGKINEIWLGKEIRFLLRHICFKGCEAYFGQTFCRSMKMMLARKGEMLSPTVGNRLHRLPYGDVESMESSSNDVKDS